MRFANKIDITTELLAGKRFRVGTGGVIHYDPRFANAFRFEHTDIGVLYELFDQDIWTEVGHTPEPETLFTTEGDNHEI
jgi:hypothetical protein